MGFGSCQVQGRHSAIGSETKNQPKSSAITDTVLRKNSFSKDQETPMRTPRSNFPRVLNVPDESLASCMCSPRKAWEWQVALVGTPDIRLFCPGCPRLEGPSVSYQEDTLRPLQCHLPSCLVPEHSTSPYGNLYPLSSKSFFKKFYPATSRGNHNLLLSPGWAHFGHFYRGKNHVPLSCLGSSLLFIAESCPLAWIALMLCTRSSCDGHLGCHHLAF